MFIVGLSARECSAQPARNDQPTAQLPNTLKVSKFTIKDTTSGLDAYTMMIPTGWQAQGQVLWDTSRTVAPSDLFVQAKNANGSVGFIHYPSMLFIWSPVYAQYVGAGRKVNGCLILAPVNGPVAALEQIVIPYYQKNLAHRYTLMGEQELPQLAAAYAPLYNQPGGPQSTIRAAKVRIEYTANGQTYDEDVRCIFLYAQGPSGVIWGIDQINCFIAPQGQLDDSATSAYMDMMALTLRPTLKFTDELDKVTQILVQGFYQDQAAIMQRAAIEEQAQQNISDQIMQGWEQRQQTMDDVAEQFDSKVIRGVQDRTNPNTGDIVQTPDEYNQVWVNGNGDYIYSNDSNYNPNSDSSVNNGNWQEIPAAN